MSTPMTSTGRSCAKSTPPSRPRSNSQVDRKLAYILAASGFEMHISMLSRSPDRNPRMPWRVRLGALPAPAWVPLGATLMYFHVRLMSWLYGDGGIHLLTISSMLLFAYFFLCATLTFACVAWL